MKISAFEVYNFRNIKRASLEFSQHLNVFYGENGSGKTSLLEALYYLALCRSFRCRNLNRIIDYDSTNFRLVAKLTNQNLSLTVGIERGRTAQDYIIRIDGKPVHSLVEIAKLIPVQLLNADSHLLIGSGPTVRRQFLDWGTFHVEPTFHLQWQRANRLLKQRNALLKSTSSRQELQTWDIELAHIANLLHDYRTNYYHLLKQQFQPLAAAFLPNLSIDLQYYPGWNTQHPLNELLSLNFNKDKQLGYTHLGPHRADLRLRVADAPAHEILSQGQQKMLTYGLRFAQAITFKIHSNSHCLFIVDDLASELDISNRRLITDRLSSMDSQIFISCIAREQLLDLTRMQDVRTFHVKRGQIEVMNT